MNLFETFMQQLLSTPASRSGLCSCPCHVSGIYGGTSCPPSCSGRGAKLDGCHRCGCPGTTCVLGECYTAARNPQVTPPFNLGQRIRWKRQPDKLARVAVVHFGVCTIQLFDPIEGAPSRLNIKFAELRDWFEAG